jgi:hypothetical protein
LRGIAKLKSSELILNYRPRDSLLNKYISAIFQFKEIGQTLQTLRLKNERKASAGKVHTCSKDREIHYRSYPFPSSSLNCVRRLTQRLAFVIPGRRGLTFRKCKERPSHSPANKSAVTKLFYPTPRDEPGVNAQFRQFAGALTSYV